MTQPKPEAEADAFERRRAGNDRTGNVSLYSFDEGVIRTMRPHLIDDNYWLKITSVDAPPDRPGIPVTFAYPEDVFEKHFLPAVVVRRDDISAAMQRWHPDGISYLTPAKGAMKVSVDLPSGTVTSWNKVEQKRQSEPVDILYTVSILARHRKGIGASKEANAILTYLLQFYQAYGPLEVIDDIGDIRTYEMFREGISMLDDLPDVSGRIIGFALSLRIEAELDVAGLQEFRTVTSRLVNTEVIDLMWKNKAYHS